MIVVIIIQLFIWYYFVQFFNTYAYYEEVWGRNKVYVNRFLQIVGYLLSLVPMMIIVQIFIGVVAITMFEYPNVNMSDKKWYKWLFENPNE